MWTWNSYVSNTCTYVELSVEAECRSYTITTGKTEADETKGGSIFDDSNCNFPDAGDVNLD